MKPLRSRAAAIVSAAALLFLTAPAPISAQPASVRPTLRLPELSAEAARGAARPGMATIAVRRNLSRAAADTGKWHGSIWRVQLQSPGAAGLRIHFTNFDVGKGQVEVFGLTSAEPLSYTGTGPDGDGEFWTPVLFSDSVAIEYAPKSGQAEALPFRIDAVSHWLAGAATRPAALACELDAACYPEWSDVGRSVARIAFETSDGGYLCSGVLVAPRRSGDPPYFLTANHCITNDAEAKSVQFFWMYQAARCGAPAPDIRSAPTSSGAALVVVASGDLGDASLLRLAASPPAGTPASFNFAKLAEDSKVTGIHHPAGDYRRISFGVYTPTTGMCSSGYYPIFWSLGITEPGSSGSPIFNTQGEVVGLLSSGPRPRAGQTYCDISPPRDCYSSLAAASTPFSRYLTPDSPAPGPVIPGVTKLVSGSPVRVSLPAVPGPTLWLQQLYAIDLPADASKLTVRVNTATPGVDVDLFVRFNSAPAAAPALLTDYSGEGLSGNETIIATRTGWPPLRTGTYWIALAMITPGRAAEVELTAFVEQASTRPSEPITLRFDAPLTISLPATDRPILLNGASGYRIVVPEGARRLLVRVDSVAPPADIDLFLRTDKDVGVDAGGNVVADWSAETVLPSEELTVTTESAPPLQPGEYRLALALFPTRVPTTAVLTVRMER
jgi:hypothetical protein